MERDYISTFRKGKIISFRDNGERDLYDMGWICPCRSLLEEDIINAGAYSVKNKIDINLWKVCAILQGNVYCLINGRENSSSLSVS